MRKEAHEGQALLRSGIDWGSLLQTACDHAVIPLVYRRLSARLQAVPEEVLGSLRDESLKNSRPSLGLTRELLGLLALLEAEKVAGIPYKGPTLAASAYGDIALRQFVDLDLIVRKRDVLRVKELMVRPQ